MIKVYTLEYCSYCKRLLELLDREGLKYINIEADSYEHEREVEYLEDFLNTSIYPIVFVEKDGIRTYLASGEKSNVVGLGEATLIYYVSIANLFTLIKKLYEK